MALKNQTEGIGVPIGGVRKDFSRFAMPPEGLHDGMNVISIDGTLESRPGHLHQSWSPLTEDNQNILYAINDLGDVFRKDLTLINGWNGSSEYGAIETDSAGWLTSNTNNRIGYIDATHPSTGDEVYRLLVQAPDNTGSSIQNISLTNEQGNPLPFNYTLKISMTFGVITQRVCAGGRFWFELDHGKWVSCGQPDPDYGIAYMTEVDECDAVAHVDSDTALVCLGASKARLISADGTLKKQYQDAPPSPAPIRKNLAASDGINHYALTSDGDGMNVYKITRIGWTRVITTPDTGLNLFLDCDDAGNIGISDGKIVRIGTGHGSHWGRYADLGFTQHGSKLCGLVNGNMLWYSGTNMIELVPAPADPMTVPLSMYQFDAAAEKKIIISATPTALRRLDTSTELWVDIGDIGDIWNDGDPPEMVNPLSSASRPVFRTFDMSGNKWLVWTSPGGGLYKWEGATGYSPESEEVLSAGALCIMVLNDRLMRLNLGTGKENRIDISAHNDFTSGWGQIQIDILDDTPGIITGAREISALQGAIYKEDSIIHAISQVEFGGVTAPVRYEIVASDISGPPCPHAVIGTGDGYHIYLGIDGGVYVYDGGRLHPVAQHARYITEKQMDFARANESWGVLDKVRGLAFFFYPTAGGEPTDPYESSYLTSGIAVDVKSGSVWPVSLNSTVRGFSCGLEVDYRKDVKIGDVNTAFGAMGMKTIGSFDNIDRMVTIGFTDDQWGIHDWMSAVDLWDPIHVGWSTGYLPLGTPPHIFKTVQEAYHTFSKVEQIGMNIRWTDRRMHEVVGPPRTITDENRKTSHRNTGRLFAMDFAGSIDKKFVYEGTSMSFRKRGQR